MAVNLAMNWILNYKPHRYQLSVHRSTARFKILCWGRRGGKSHCAVHEAIIKTASRQQVLGRPTRGWIVAPTYALTREIETVLIPMLRPFLLSFNQSEHRATLVSQDVIEFKSADTPNLVGAGLDWLIVDEAARISDRIWYECLRPTLTDKMGEAVIISTPQGRGTWFYEVFQKGQDPAFPEYRSWHMPSVKNPYLLASEIEAARLEMPELIYRQEYLAEFLDDASAFFRGVDGCVTESADYSEALETRFDCQRCGHTFRVKEESLWYYDEEGKHPVTSVRCNACGAYNDRNYRKDSPIYFKGVDTANSIDFNVISVVRWHPKAPRIRLVALDRFNQVSWNVKRERIKEAHQRFPGALYLESNFDGGASAEALQYEGIPAVAVTMTNRTKAAILNRLAILIERGLIEFPAGLPNLQALLHELKIFESKQTEGGTWKFSAPEGKHDDCVISLALAVSQVPICGLEPVNLKTKKEEEAE